MLGRAFQQRVLHEHILEHDAMHQKGRGHAKVDEITQRIELGPHQADRLQQPRQPAAAVDAQLRGRDAHLLEILYEHQRQPGQIHDRPDTVQWLRVGQIVSRQGYRPVVDRRLRFERNMTQEELALRTGVSRQTIIAIEKGNYTPSVLLALKIADFFKLPVEHIFKISYEK